MSYALWWVALTAGMEDGLNPCLLMTAALVLLGMLWFKSLGISRSWFILLILVIFIDSFVFNCGAADQFLLNKYFQIAARGIYLLLGLGTGFIGLKLLKEWYDLARGKEIKISAQKHIKISPWLLLFLVCTAGLVLSALATLWPTNYYILLFGMYMIQPGQLVMLGSLILLYAATSLWFVAVVMLSTTLEVKNPRLFKIIAAAILISASIGILDIFFMKGHI